MWHYPESKSGLCASLLCVSLVQQLPFWFCRWWSSRPRWSRPRSRWPGTDHRGRTGNIPHEISVQTVEGRKIISFDNMSSTETRVCSAQCLLPSVLRDGAGTLTCLQSWVGKRSSSTSFTAALPLNRSMVIPGGRRPWCCCHFSDWWRRKIIVRTLNGR